MTTTDNFKIAGYCRISVDEQIGGDNTSIENQKAIILDYKKKNFPNSELTFFEDRDRSGYTFEQREGYQHLRKLFIQHEYDILIVKDFSRFSRRNSKGLGELEDLRDLGIRIIAITDNVDYPTNDDWLNIQFRFLMNEMPVTDTSKKVRAIVKSRQEKGEWICNVPYGYYLHPTKKNTVCIDDEGADAVNLIFELYNKNWGYKKIAQYLTEKNFPTGLQLIARQMKARGVASTKVEKKASPVWSHISVSKIVQNDFYIGTLRQHMWARKGINKSDKRIPQEENIVFENHHEPIISKEIFNKAQQNYNRRSVTHYNGHRKYEHTYSGLFYCEDCGSPMFATTASYRESGYTCSNYHKHGLKACTSHHIHEKTIDDSIRSYIISVRDNLKDALINLDMEKSKQQAEANNRSAKEFENKLREIKQQLKQSTKQRLQQIIRNPENEKLLNETFDELENEFLLEIKQLERQIDYLSTEAEKKSEIKKNINNVLSTFDSLLSKKHFSKEDILLILERISVNNDKILTIELKSDISELIAMSTI